MLKLLAVPFCEKSFFSTLYAQISTPFCETGVEPCMPRDFEWIKWITPKQLEGWVAFCSEKLAMFPENSKPWFDVQLKKAVVLKLAYGNSACEPWIREHMQTQNLFKRTTICSNLPNWYEVEMDSLQQKVVVDLTKSFGVGSYGTVNPGVIGSKEIAVKRIKLSNYIDLFSAFLEYASLCFLGEGSSQKGARIVPCLGACCVQRGDVTEAWILLDRYPRNLEQYIHNIHKFNFERVYSFFCEVKNQLDTRKINWETVSIEQIRSPLSESMTSKRDIADLLKPYETARGFLHVAYRVYRDMKTVVNDKQDETDAFNRLKTFFNTSRSFEDKDRGGFQGFLRMLGFMTYQFGVMDQVFLDIAKSLSLVHAQKFAFLDLKDTNILMDSHNRAFLTDFGFTSFYNADIYPLFSESLAGIGGTSRPLFIFDAATTFCDYRTAHTTNIRALLNRPDTMSDLRNVDIFAFGVLIASYFTKKLIHSNHVRFKHCMADFVTDALDTIRSMKDAPEVSLQKRLWMDIAIKCLEVSFDKPILIDDIIKDVDAHNAIVRRGAEFALDGVISKLEKIASSTRGSSKIRKRYPELRQFSGHT